MSKIENFILEITPLKRMRKVWVYLPDNYSEKGKGFPVIYMHDGQNLFYDELTAYGTAWHVDKCLDDIYAKTGKSCIVVGVENDGERRLSEYSPFKIHPIAFKEKRTLAKHDRGGEGAQYSQWFATELKSYIDQHYNTDKERNATAVAGSSMGGLISCYLGLKYQHVYETMGLFSTYTQFNQAAFNRFVRNTTYVEHQHAFIYCGGDEWDEYTSSERMVRDSYNLYKVLVKRFNVHCQLVVDSKLHHEESAWEIYFYKFAQDFLERFADRGGK